MESDDDIRDRINMRKVDENSRRPTRDGRLPKDSCIRSRVDLATNSPGLNIKWTILMGKILIFMTICSVLTVGLFVNILQFTLLIFRKLSDNRKWQRLIKKINGQLMYITFAPMVFLLYSWSKIKLDIQLDNVDLVEAAKKPMMAIIVPNHSYELDYMVCFALADQLGNMGAYKSMAKNELKYVPIMGWALWMSDIIFVKRSWKQDKVDIGKKLDQLFDYEQSILGIFAEGTRWTEEKHQISKNFAKSIGLQPLKYHLIPRSRGFNFSVRHYLREIAINKRAEESQFMMLNMEIIMPDKPNFQDFIEGRQIVAHIYFEEVHLSDEIKREAIESRDEDDCPKLTNLLMQIYRRKDEIVENFHNNGDRFKVTSPNGGPFPIVDRKAPFIIWLLGFCGTYSLLGYLAVTYFANSVIFWSLVVGYVSACAWVLRRVERESQAKPLAQTNYSGHKFRPKVSGGQREKRVSFVIDEMDDGRKPNSTISSGVMDKNGVINGSKQSLVDQNSNRLSCDDATLSTSPAY